jgi:hypothetical protein
MTFMDWCLYSYLVYANVITKVVALLVPKLVVEWGSRERGCLLATVW